MGYQILMDTYTKTYFMHPNEFRFFVFSEGYDETCLPTEIIANPNHYLLKTDIEDMSELETYLFNLGFIEGYFDGRLYRINKSNILYYKPNPNPLLYAQFMLTKQNNQKSCINYLQSINKAKLWSYTKSDNTKLLFPSVPTKNGTKILAYTETKYIPKQIRDEYIKNGYSLIQLGEISEQLQVVINDFDICSGKQNTTE